MSNKGFSPPWFLFLLVFTISVAGGCSDTGAKPLSLKALKPGQGILGIVLLSDDYIEHFYMRGPGGKTLSRKDLGKGPHLLLFALYQGRYCVTRITFSHGRMKFGQEDDDLCFPVVAGRVGYVGHYLLMPDSDSRNIIRLDRPQRFKKAIEEKYPGLTLKYPVIDLLKLDLTRNPHEDDKQHLSFMHTRGWEYGYDPNLEK